MNEHQQCLVEKATERPNGMLPKRIAFLMPAALLALPMLALLLLTSCQPSEPSRSPAPPPQHTGSVDRPTGPNDAADPKLEGDRDAEPETVRRPPAAPPSSPPVASDWPTQVRIETNRDVYAPLDPIYVTLINESPYPVYVCPREVEGWYEPVGDWNGSYGMGVDCGGNWPTRETVIEDMRRVGPGVTFHDTLHVNARAYEGRWRVAYTLLDEQGEPLPWGYRVSEFRVVHE